MAIKLGRLLARKLNRSLSPATVEVETKGPADQVDPEQVANNEALAELAAKAAKDLAAKKKAANEKRAATIAAKKEAIAKAAEELAAKKKAANEKRAATIAAKKAEVQSQSKTKTK